MMSNAAYNYFGFCNSGGLARAVFVAQSRPPAGTIPGTIPQVVI